MGDKWIEVSLSEIAERIGDGLHGTPKYSEQGKYHFINGNNLEDGVITIKESTKKVGFEQYTKHKKELNENAILVSINGTIGNVALYNDEEIILGKSACYINLKDNIHREFVAYVLTSFQFQEYIQRCATGSTIKNVSLKMMREFAFRIPEDEVVQIDAVATLKNIDLKIRLNRQTNQTIEQMAQALFKSWFVDFDPVFDNAFDAGLSVDDFPDELQHRAMLRQQHRSEAMKQDAEVMLRQQTPQSNAVLQPQNQQATQTESERICGLFPSEFEQCDDPNIGINGWIPKGWAIKAFSELLDVKYGKDHKKLGDGNYPIYGSGGLMRYAENFLYAGESVLIPRKGTLTNIMYVNESFWTVDTMFYTIPKMDNIVKYMFYHLKTLDFLLMNVGSAVPSMTTKVLNALQIINPSNELLQKFDETINVFRRKRSSNQVNTENLVILRDTLLPKLISGELQLSETVQSIETK